MATYYNTLCKCQNQRSCRNEESSLFRRWKFVNEHNGARGRIHKAVLSQDESYVLFLYNRPCSPTIPRTHLILGGLHPSSPKPEEDLSQLINQFRLS